MFGRWCFFITQGGCLHPVGLSWNSVPGPRTKESPLSPDTAVQWDRHLSFPASQWEPFMGRHHGLCTQAGHDWLCSYSVFNHVHTGAFDLISPNLRILICQNGVNTTSLPTLLWGLISSHTERSSNGAWNMGHIQSSAMSSFWQDRFSRLSRQAHGSPQNWHWLSLQTCFIQLNAVFNTGNCPVSRRPHDSQLSRAAYFMH